MMEWCGRERARGYRPSLGSRSTAGSSPPARRYPTSLHCVRAGGHEAEGSPARADSPSHACAPPGTSRHTRQGHADADARAAFRAVLEARLAAEVPAAQVLDKIEAGVRGQRRIEV